MARKDSDKGIYLGPMDVSGKTNGPMSGPKTGAAVTPGGGPRTKPSKAAK